MNKTVENLIDNLQTAAIYAGALMEQNCNSYNYVEACVYQNIRDTLRAQAKAVESLQIVKSEKEKRKNEN